jgi:4'-phosphopantetheinyl transferase
MLSEHCRQTIQVCYAVVPETPDCDWLAVQLGLLSSDERQRYGRFHFDRDRYSYLTAHALLRTCLSTCADLAPADWSFAARRHGRPEITNPGLEALRFNLSHTSGLVACVICHEDDCGIDVESVRNARHQLDSIAQRMFSATEAAALAVLSGEARSRYFFQHWTLREAYVKALGVGIGFPTHKLVFSVDDSGIHLSLGAGIEGQVDNWQFSLLEPDDQHLVALALRRDGGLRKPVHKRLIDLSTT